VTREALTIASWLGAGVVAWYGFGPARALARQTIENAWLADAAAFGVTFVAPLIGFKIVAAMLADRIPGGSLGLFDRIAGLAFGAARGAVIVSAAYLGLTIAIAPEDQPAWVRQALVLPYVEDGADMLRRLMPAQFTSDEAADAARREGAKLGRSARQLATQ
jgi:membrane protein required for colicin V production